MVILGHGLGYTRDVLEFVVNNLVAVQGHRYAVDFIPDELGSMHAKLEDTD